MKLGDRVKTPYGDGTIKKAESNRVEIRYGVKMDSLEKVPFCVDLEEPERWEAYPDGILFFFKSELTKL